MFLSLSSTERLKRQKVKSCFSKPQSPKRPVGSRFPSSPLTKCKNEIVVQEWTQVDDRAVMAYSLVTGDWSRNVRTFP